MCSDMHNLLVVFTCFYTFFKNSKMASNPSRVFQETYSFNKDFPSFAESCTVSLKHKHLWEQFHGLGTEMIVTKSGRRMFPAIQIDIKGLDPNALYYVYLEFHQESKCRYKYSSSIGWTPAGHEETQTGNHRYLHPDSPQLGEHWMSQVVSFGRVKLTNSTSASLSHIVLNSMHKYEPTILIVKTVKTTSPAYPHQWHTACVKPLKETQFIAVTAYQNEKITKLKIDNNPFAKGFRENGKSSSTKRKANDSEETTSTASNDSQDASSPPSSPSNSEMSPTSIASAEVSSVKTFPIIPLPMPMPNIPSRYGYSYWGHVFNDPALVCPFYPSYCYNYGPSVFSSNLSMYPSPPQPKLSSNSNELISQQNSNSKKTTDHSIRKITGIM